MMDIVQAMRDPNLFGDTFGDDSHTAWQALLGGFYGLPMDDAAFQHGTMTLTSGRLGCCRIAPGFD